MAVRPLIKLLLRTNALAEPNPDLPVAERRAAAAESAEKLVKFFQQAREPLTVADHDVPVSALGEGHVVKVRVYVPDGTKPLPAHLYMHGGAFWLGSVAEYDILTRWYAAKAGCTVVSVDYSLAPENKYPTQVEECYAALVWLAENAEMLGIDTTRVSVGGTSAGGSLAAAVTLMARDRNGPAIRFQLLEIPATDCGLDHPSMDEFADGYGLTREEVAEGIDFYLADPAQADEAYASPLRAKDLTGLPPTAILTCEYDPLRDEGEAFGARLREAGVPVAMRRYAGHIHSSTYATRLMPSARRYLDDIRRALMASQRPVE
jgi:acetyl esterase